MPTIRGQINSFNGGLTEDKRTPDSSKYSITKGFDALTYPHKLVPHYQLTADETKAFFITKFLYAPSNYPTNTSFKLWGYGVPSGDATSGKISVYFYNIDSGLPQSWVLATNGSSSSGTRAAGENDVFFYYKGYIYMWKGSNSLVRFDTAQSVAFNEAFQTITWTNVAQPVHHLTNDYAYFFQDNAVHTYNGTTFNLTGTTTPVLTLPTNVKITCACAYGDYLAIGCTTLDSSAPHAYVFLWDLFSTTWNTRIDFGEGKLKHLANLENRLTAVVDYYVTNSYGFFRGKIFVKQMAGEFGVTVNTLTVDAAIGTDDFPPTRHVTDNRLYFPLKATLNGDTRYGIWSVDSLGRITLDQSVEGATSYQGIFSTGNLWWIAHSGDGSVERTDDSRAFSATNPAIYESLIRNDGDSGQTKTLVGVTVTTEPLASGASYTLRYRKDEETSWTTIFTQSTLSSIAHDAINIESTGVNLPEYNEIQFRIESVGASITGISYKSETKDDGLY